MVLDQKLEIPAALRKPHVPRNHNSSHQRCPCREMEAHSGGLQLTCQHHRVGRRDSQGPVRLQLVRLEGRAVCASAHSLGFVGGQNTIYHHIFKEYPQVSWDHMRGSVVREGSQRGKGLPENVCVASAKETASALAVDFQITPLALDKRCWKTHMLLWKQNCPEAGSV